MDTNILAAIDIGSNAIRLLINNIEKNGAEADFKKIAFLRVPIRLGEEVFTKGRISEDKKSQLIDTMQGFSHIMKAYGVSDYRACATSAMRDAKNGRDIKDAILAESGIDIKIITGNDEAGIICEASKLENVIENRNYLYIDVGGGSTEVVVYGNHQKITSHSFQMGTVRMLVDAVTEGEVKLFRSWLKTIYMRYEPVSIIASGGNINKIHKVLGKREKEALTYSDVKKLYDALKNLSYEERIQNFKLNAYRADVIIPALKIFLTVCKTCKINEIYVPKVGLVDGIIHHLYLEKEGK